MRYTVTDQHSLWPCGSQQSWAALHALECVAVLYNMKQFSATNVSTSFLYGTAAHAHFMWFFTSTVQKKKYKKNSEHYPLCPTLGGLWDEVHKNSVVSQRNIFVEFWKTEEALESCSISGEAPRSQVVLGRCYLTHFFCFTNLVLWVRVKVVWSKLMELDQQVCVVSFFAKLWNLWK